MMKGDKNICVQHVRDVKRVVAEGVRWTGAVAQSTAAAGLKTAATLQRATLGLVFPGTCLSCHAEMGGEAEDEYAVPLCKGCLDEIDIFDGPTCRRCGAPVPNLGFDGDGQTQAPAKDAGCYRCRGRKLWFAETVAAGLYSGRLREVLLLMKQVRGDPLSLAVAGLMWKLRGERLAALEADVVVPIPLHWRRRVAHRTNSAALMAEVFARRLRRPLADGLLRRRRHTAPQFSLTPPQRWDNVRQAFLVRGSYHLNKAHVLLVDDILTTGATCSEAARALRKAGAKRVTVVVAARAVH